VVVIVLCLSCIRSCDPDVIGLGGALANDVMAWWTASNPRNP